MTKKILYFISVLVLGTIIGTGGTLLVQKITGPKQTVNVTGQGIVEAVADQANITLSVTNTSWSQEQATKDNKEEVSKLKDNLNALGIPESRITQYSSSELMTSPNQAAFLIPPPSAIKGTIPAPLPIVGNQNNPSVTTNLSITLDTIQGIDKVFAAIKESPNAKIANTSYTLKNSSTYESQAREKAITDARNQAESIAKINHLRIGKLLSLNNGFSPIYMKGELQGTGGSASSNTSISYGEKTIPISATYNVQYELY